MDIASEDAGVRHNTDKASLTLPIRHGSDKRRAEGMTVLLRLLRYIADRKAASPEERLIDAALIFLDTSQGESSEETARVCAQHCSAWQLNM